MVLGALLIGGAYASAWLPAGTPIWAAWLMAIGAGLLLGGTLLLGAWHPRGRGVALAAIFLVTVVVAGFGLALVLPAEGASGPLWLGLPRRVGLMITLLVVAPLAVLPMAYARDFRGRVPDEATLDRLRDAIRRARPDTAGRAGES
jgi:hypothetical protein